MRVAIVGSGPAGMFTAEFLSKDPSTRVDLYERRPVPFGLLRYGVAPDHGGTKAIARQFERTLARPNVSLRCGVEIGVHASLADLLQRYDHLVLASGCGPGRRLAHGLPVAQELTGLELLRWMNGDPEVDLRLGAGIRRVLVLGHGNVSLDVVRLLASAGAAPAAGAAVRWLQELALEDIQIWGRGSAADTRFSAQSLQELEGLARFRPVTTAAEVAGHCSVSNPDALEVLRRWAGPGDDARCPIRLRFGGACLVDPDFVPDLVVHCIGQQVAAIGGQEPADWIRGLAPQEQARVHAVGWAAGGHAGAIPASRAQAKAVVDRMRAGPDAVP